MHLFLNKHLGIASVSENIILPLVITEGKLIFRIHYVWFLGVFGGLFREVFASTIPEPRHQSMFTHHHQYDVRQPREIVLCCGEEKWEDPGWHEGKLQKTHVLPKELVHTRLGCFTYFTYLKWTIHHECQCKCLSTWKTSFPIAQAVFFFQLIVNQSMRIQCVSVQSKNC